MKSRLRRLAGFVVLAAVAALPASVALAQSQKVLKFIPQADLRILDPISTTAYITQSWLHGVRHAVCDGREFQVKPQMVDKFDVSKDQLTYTFTLRDGLKFHDGQPVRSADCIASIDRWSKRDALGQKLAEATESWSAVDDKTFRLKLKKPFPLALEALAKPSSNVPFIMPERIAKTDPFKNIDDPIGSGPFKFVKSGMGARKQVVYVKNTDYVPRKEPPSWASGGKVVKVDRVEWITFLIRPPRPLRSARAKPIGGKTCQRTWFAAFQNKNITVKNIDPMGSMGMIRFNFLHPPFNNVKMRQALLYAINQQDYVIGIAGDPNGNPCYSYFTCGTPLIRGGGRPA